MCQKYIYTSADILTQSVLNSIHLDIRTFQMTDFAFVRLNLCQHYINQHYINRVVLIPVRQEKKHEIPGFTFAISPISYS